MTGSNLLTKKVSETLEIPRHLVGCTKNLGRPGNTGAILSAEPGFPPHPSGFSSFRFSHQWYAFNMASDESAYVHRKLLKVWAGRSSCRECSRFS